MMSARATRRERPSPRRRGLVLVAEDRDSTFEVIRLLCEMEGTAVLRAMSTRAAIALARVGQPDLILLGSGLADGPPARAARAIGRDPSTRRIPVVRICPAGAAARDEWTLGRPVNPAKLLDLLRRRFPRPRRATS